MDGHALAGGEDGPASGAAGRPSGVIHAVPTAPGAPSRWWLSWRTLWLATVAVGAVAFAAANRSQVPLVARVLRQANPRFVGLALAICALGLLNQAALHHATQRAVGLRPRFMKSLQAATAALFLNLVVKSGGMAGATAFVRADPGGHRRGRVVVAYLLATLLGQLTFAVVLAASLVLIWEDGRLTSVDMAASLVFAGIMAGVLAALVAGLHSREALRRVHSLPRRIALRARTILGPPNAASPRGGADHSGADDLYDAVQVLARRPARATSAVAHAFGVEALGTASLWSVLRALGAQPGWTLALVAYAVSVLFAIVGFLPGGLGFVEAGLGAVLVSYGITGPVAVAAVVLYRLFELWIPVAVGAWTAQSLVRSPSPV